MPVEPTPAAAVRVWDPLVRVLHWSTVAGVAVSWITSEVGRGLHEPVGWAVMAFVAVRLVWGLAGPRHARFASFVRGPTAVAAYAGQALRGREARYLGHNPLGGWMIVALLATLCGVGLTGWLMGTDRWWGDEFMEDVHEALAVLLLVLAGLHVAGAIVTGFKHGENLVRAMVTGEKRAAQPGDID